MRGRALLGAQIAATAVAVSLMSMPRSDGPLLVVPILADGSRAVGVALANGARLVDGGWLPGSVVVRGERRRLVPALLREGVLVIAAPDQGCGSARTRRE